MDRFGTCYHFELPNGFPPTAQTMIEVFLPDEVLDKWVTSTNAYIESKVPSVRRQKEITRPDILRFMATVQYMALAELPNKNDYWPSTLGGEWADFLPNHPAIQLDRSRFDYLWHFFHTSYTAGAPVDTVANEDSDEEILRWQYDLEEDEEDEDLLSQIYNVEEAKPSWYSSVEEFIDHVNKTSQKLCKNPSWQNSNDEILKTFHGGRFAPPYTMTPRFRCRRTWMIMWLHCLDVCRVNSYIIAREKEKRGDRLWLVQDWIRALNKRAFFVETQRTNTAIAASPPTGSHGK
ncbi:transposase IS4 [Nitzschia inconspicua]|uniref:Transposase IS4 n=1 Tax=Nitzschia inconspicua TaxID=303405 RepID=A0A9K3PYZ0_9STRA|nr:transposase IS4 [Nitzschia inconspicua]